MQWQFVSKWQILHLLDVQKHKSSYEFVMGWMTPFYIVGHFALLNWHIRACWKDVCLCPLQFFTPTLCCRLASVYSWTSKSRAPCANISGRLLRLTSCNIMERHYWEEASLQIARWWDWGLLWLERKCSPLCEMTCAQQKLQHKQLQISQICKENQRLSPAPLHNANRQKDGLAEDTHLWLSFGPNTSNSRTNSFLMVCKARHVFLLPLFLFWYHVGKQIERWLKCKMTVCIL